MEPETLRELEELADRGTPLYRTAILRSIDDTARTATLAFSSEEPVERYFGIEILSHAEGAVRLGRLADGAPLLLEHNRNAHIGVVEGVSIDPDKRGRALVRFGRSARAEEVFQDVRDGIRRHVSVGYAIHRYDVQERKGQPDLVTATDWEPFEVSLVSIPADQTVGVGRARDADAPGGAPARMREGERQEPGKVHEDAQASKETTMTKIVRDAEGNLVRAKVDDAGQILEVIEVIERAGEAERAAETRARGAEQSRVGDLLAMGDQYDARDLAHAHVRENKTPAQLQAAILERMSSARSKPLPADGDLGLSDQEVGRFSFVKAIRALANPSDRRAAAEAAFEFEVSEAGAQRAEKKPQGFYIPPEVLSRTFNTGTSGATVGDTGGYSIATTLLSGSFIDVLRARSVVMRRAASLSGLVGDVDIPRKTGVSQAGWIGEDEEAPKSGPELGDISLTPKTAAVFYDITRKLLKQSSLDIEAMVRTDMATAVALEIDRAAIYGSGTAKQPLGVANTSGINAVILAAAGQPTFGDLIDMESEIATENADVGGIIYVMHPRVRGHFKKTVAAEGTASWIWEQNGTINGYQTEVTTQLLPGDVLMGNFQDLIVGMWGGLDMIVDPFTESRRGRTRITMMQDVDFAVRRPQSFCLARAAAGP